MLKEITMVTKRFLNYVKFDTMADAESNTCPSSPNQWELARYLENELKEIGMDEVSLDENGYVMATLKANTEGVSKTVGFIAHMDTSDAMSGANVKPRIVKYTGEAIVLNEDLNIRLSKEEFPELERYVNQDIIVTDGTTLLGADDKAGIAEIITAMEYLIQHPEIKHGDIKVAFTPDEEIGRGADLFNVEKFNADFAYTLDGGVIGELQYETFNAAEAKITVKGKSVHPGDSKGKMINAVLIASEIASMFPEDQRPETTEGYEGFYHLVSIKGDVENASLYYIIREFDKENFHNRKEFVKEVVNKINTKYQNKIVSLEVNDQYYNMKEKLIDHMYILEYAKQAMEELGIEPIIVPVRGGTDGSKLSFMGLLTPNIFAGGHNFHGKYEFIPTQSMEKAVELIVRISENLAK
jgi:tripeptide aminopeptidase